MEGGTRYSYLWKQDVTTLGRGAEEVAHSVSAFFVPAKEVYSKDSFPQIPTTPVALWQAMDVRTFLIT